jgi:hypothetical protein
MPDQKEVYDQPSEAEAQERTVHIHGPDNTELAMTPRAAIETAQRIGEAAVDALLEQSTRDAMVPSPSDLPIVKPLPVGIEPPTDRLQGGCSTS